MVSYSPFTWGWVVDQSCHSCTLGSTTSCRWVRTLTQTADEKTSTPGCFSASDAASFDAATFKSVECPAPDVVKATVLQCKSSANMGYHVGAAGYAILILMASGTALSVFGGCEFKGCVNERTPSRWPLVLSSVCHCLVAIAVLVWACYWLWNLGQSMLRLSVLLLIILLTPCLCGFPNFVLAVSTAPSHI